MTLKIEIEGLAKETEVHAKARLVLLKEQLGLKETEAEALTKLWNTERYRPCGSGALLSNITDNLLQGGSSKN